MLTLNIKNVLCFRKVDSNHVNLPKCWNQSDLFSDRNGLPYLSPVILQMKTSQHSYLQYTLNNNSHLHSLYQLKARNRFTVFCEHCAGSNIYITFAVIFKTHNAARLYNNKDPKSFGFSGIWGVVLQHSEGNYWVNM